MINHLQSPLPVHDREAVSEIPKLTVEGVTKSFIGRGKILKDVSFSISKGQKLALIGGNGSGKSTLLRCCLRLVQPDSGAILLLGQDISTLSRKDLRKLRSRVGLVFQRHNLVPRLSVLTNVIHGALGRNHSISLWRQYFAPADIRDEAMYCLEKVGLPHLASSRADKLSGGESQRVAIARALMQKPEFLMADEPAASLDPKVGSEVMELFTRLAEDENITLLFVSHDLDHALTYSTNLVGLKHGQVVINGKSNGYSSNELNKIYK